MSWLRSLRNAAKLMTVAAMLVSPALVRGQGAARLGGAEAGRDGLQVKTGRILELETKGKATTLKVETSDGETYDLKVAPTLEFSVIGQGDAGFVKPGMYLIARGTMSEEKIFLSKATIQLVPKGKKPSPGRIVKAPAQAGASVNTYDVAGEIVSAGPPEGYDDYTVVLLKIAGRNPPVWFEPKYEVQVSSSDPAHAAVGNGLELALKPLRGGKFQPVGVRIHRDTPFSSEEVLGGDGKPD